MLEDLVRNLGKFLYRKQCVSIDFICLKKYTYIYSNLIGNERDEWGKNTEKKEVFVKSFAFA